MCSNCIRNCMGLKRQQFLYFKTQRDKKKKHRKTQMNVDRNREKKMRMLETKRKKINPLFVMAM